MANLTERPPRKSNLTKAALFGLALSLGGKASESHAQDTHLINFEATEQQVSGYLNLAQEKPYECMKERENWINTDHALAIAQSFIAHQPEYTLTVIQESENISDQVKNDLKAKATENLLRTSNSYIEIFDLEEPLRTELMSAYVEKFINIDPAKAINAIPHTSFDEKAKANYFIIAIKLICDIESPYNGVMALYQYKEQVDEKTYKKLMTHIAQQYVDTDPQATLEALPDTSLSNKDQHNLRERAARNLAMLDPEKALRNLPEYLPDDPGLLSGLMEQVSSQLTSISDELEALSYVTSENDYYKNRRELLVSTLVDWNPSSALYCYEYYQYEPWADQERKRAFELLEKIQPETFFYHLEAYIEIYGEQAAKQKTEEIIIYLAESRQYDFYDKLHDKAESSIEKTIKRFGLDHLRFYINQVEEFCAKHPQREFEHFPSKAIEVDDFPFDKEKLRAAIRATKHRARSVSSSQEVAGRGIISIPEKEFEEIFISDAFLAILEARAGTMTYMNAISLAQAVYRKLEATDKPANQDNIAQAGQEILYEIDQVRERELFGANTQLILAVHQEERFSNEAIIDRLYKDAGGTDENLLLNVKGREAMQDNKFLEAIQTSDGPTTIVFSGHGNNASFALDSQKAIIRYDEIAKALVDSGNMHNINLILSMCGSYNYGFNLQKAIVRILEQEGKSQQEIEGLVIITSNNKDSFTFGGGKWLVSNEGDGPVIDSRFLSAIDNVTESNQPITVDAFFKAESLGTVFFLEDPSITIGTQVTYGQSSDEEHLKPAFLELSRNLDVEKGVGNNSLPT